MKIDKNILSESEKNFLNTIEGLYKKSYGIYDREKSNKLYFLIKNINFLNNQNYIISEKIKNHIYSIKDIKEGSGYYYKNMIGYNEYLKIQEIDYKNIRKKRNNLKFYLYGLAIVFLAFSLFGMLSGDEDSFILFLFGIIYLPIFIFLLLYSGKLGNSNLKIYRNKDKIIFYKN